MKKSNKPQFLGEPIEPVKNQKSPIDFCADDLRFLITEVAAKAQHGTHEEFRYAWEQLQQKQGLFLSLVYGSPRTAQRIYHDPTVGPETFDLNA